MTGSPPQCSQRGTVCGPSPLRFLAQGVGISGVSPRETEKSTRGEVRAGIISVLPGLSFRRWLSTQLWMSLRQVDMRAETWTPVCLKEKNTFICIAVVRQPMSSNNRVKGFSIEGEEKDRALGNSCGKGQRCLYSTATRKVGLIPA